MNPDQPYTDPSDTIRSEWTGVEVEGRFKGLLTRFYTRLPADNATSVIEPHVFLCPTVIQSASTQDLDCFITALTDADKVVTLALRPTDLPLLSPVASVFAHIMLDIPIYGADRLKPSDTIKIEAAPYTTFSTSFEQTVQTRPADYQLDKRIQ